MASIRAGLVGAVASPLFAGAIAGYAGAQTAEQGLRAGMIGSAFSMATLSAKVGDTLRFLNDDSEDHTMFVPTRGFAIDLGTQKPGTEAAMVLARRGRFRVECVNHADMLLDVTVAR